MKDFFSLYQKIRIKEYEVLKQENLPIPPWGYLYIDGVPFTPSMRHLCGAEFVVNNVNEDHTRTYINGWEITPNMCECVAEKDYKDISSDSVAELLYD